MNLTGKSVTRVATTVTRVAALALLVAFAGAFELGRYQGERLDATQTAGASDSDVPVDFLMDGLL